jgi:hypothetical protein
MPTLKALFAAKATITVTLTSLADGGARETTVVDNTTNLYLDALLRIKSNGLAGSTALLEVYAYAALSDNDYTDGATGTDAAFTTANIKNAIPVGSVQMNGATAIKAGPFSIAAAFGGVLPSKWGLIFKNASGAALSATAGDHVIEFQGVQAQSA